MTGQRTALLEEDVFLREEPRMFLDETWLAKRIYRFEDVEGVIERQESSSSIDNCAICLENYSAD